MMENDDNDIEISIHKLDGRNQTSDSEGIWDGFLTKLVTNTIFWLILITEFSTYGLKLSSCYLKTFSNSKSKSWKSVGRNPAGGEAEKFVLESG